ncbi:DNA replication initiation control protein YabA [Agrilactobacillus yilanensis]|uniref:Replication initiation control protein YabA n=1 Tax=Agrilactobacillus yilanensis TaxID=2485997 RepID=A0ABW4J7H8_9LACO|nr:DNA replication initiation control protein YabA [Agrilactobacillus yilanensis]
MDNKDLYDQLQELEVSQTAQLAKLKGLQDHLAQILEQNSELKIENQHLRIRLQELEDTATDKDDPTKGLSKSRKHLEKLYEEGFHVCTYFYGSRRENKESCAFCLDVIYGDHQSR